MGLCTHFLNQQLNKRIQPISDMNQLLKTAIQLAKFLIQGLKDVNQRLKMLIQRLKRLNQVLKKMIQPPEIAQKRRPLRPNSIIIQIGYGMVLNRRFDREKSLPNAAATRPQNAQA